VIRERRRVGEHRVAVDRAALEQARRALERVQHAIDPMMRISSL
jgi:hypothetical protein